MGRPVTVDGNVKLGLEKIANKALKRAGAAIKGKFATKLKVYEAKLYSEFVGRYTHEYQARAEKRISARAHKIANRRVKKINKKHKVKVTKTQALKYFKQAKKQQEGHAVRQIQLNFKKHLKQWTNAKMKAEKERLVRASHDRHHEKRKAKAKKNLKKLKNKAKSLKKADKAKSKAKD